MIFRRLVLHPRVLHPRESLTSISRNRSLPAGQGFLYILPLSQLNVQLLRPQSSHLPSLHQASAGPTPHPVGADTSALLNISFNEPSAALSTTI